MSQAGRHCRELWVGPCCLWLPPSLEPASPPDDPVQHARQAQLVDPELEALLEVTAAELDANQTHPLDQLPALLELLRGRDLEPERLRGRRRLAGGMEGEEIVLRVGQGAASRLLCLWCGSWEAPAPVAHSPVELQDPLAGQTLLDANPLGGQTLLDLRAPLDPHHPEAQAAPGRQDPLDAGRLVLQLSLPGQMLDQGLALWDGILEHLVHAQLGYEPDRSHR